MSPVTQITGVAAPLSIDNIDTDTILPGRYLKTISRVGLREGLFADLRGADFILDREGFRGARILVAGMNFGCGSSREHAPWALLDHGISCVVATGFADIFFANAVNCGLLPAQVDPTTAAALADLLGRAPVEMTVDLVECTLALPDGWKAAFTIPDAARDRLLRGLDLIGETLAEEAAIAAFEAARGYPEGY